MSILEKIELTEILGKIGLTEFQFRGILEGEVKRLSDQEVVLNNQISAHATKINELSVQRRIAAEAAEASKLEIEAQNKKLIEFREQVAQERRDSEKEKQNLLILRAKLNDDRDQFAKDRAFYTAKHEALNLDIKKQSELLAELTAKSRELDKAKDELFITQANVNSDSKVILETKQELERQKSIIAGELATAKDLQKALAEDANKTGALKESLSQEHSEKLSELEDDKRVFEADKAAMLENFRQRELGLTRKEKEIKKAEQDIKARLEDIEIKESNPAEVVPEKKKSKKQG